jgi:hypothetical protein
MWVFENPVSFLDGLMVTFLADVEKKATSTLVSVASVLAYVLVLAKPCPSL